MTATTLSRTVSPRRSRKPARQTAVRYSAQYSFLVISYGDELCGDAAASALVARTVASWHLPEVKTITIPQLLPELATEIAKVDYVIFVGVCPEESRARTVQLSPISASSAGSATTLPHAHSVQGLLLLAQKLYGHTPPAWLLQLPTESFNIGEQLSSTAQRGSDEAIQTIERFLVNYQVPYPAAL